MSSPTSDNYTTDYIYSLPDGQRAELINGVIYDKATPDRMHQEICFSLSRKIADYIDSHGGLCKVYLAPFAVFLNEHDKTYIEPDISVICDKNKLDDRGCNGAPDFIIEVVSPSSRQMDYITKMNLYGNAGVREYWIVDPAKEHSVVYRYEEDAAPDMFPFDQTISVSIYGDLQINIAELLE